MFVKKVRQFIESKGLIARRDSVLVAVSGGADSMALLHVLSELRGEMDFDLAAAHLDHGLRGKSAEEDSMHVDRACQSLGLACSFERVDTRGFAETSRLSLEEAARELRYRFLKTVAESEQHNRIALGHTMNDQAETVLMRLIRGAGILGLSAMKPVSEGIYIRPLLATSRSDVLEFLASRAITYREDSSNVDRTFLRNRIRHDLIGILKEGYNPRIVELLCSHASVLSQAEDYILLAAGQAYERCVLKESKENIELELPAFLSYHTCIQSYILREAYRRLRGNIRNLDFSHVASLLKLASSGQSGNSVDVPSGISAWLNGKSFLIGSRAALHSAGPVISKFLVRLEPGRAVWLPEISLGIDSKLFRKEKLSDDFVRREPQQVFFDLEELQPPFVLRNLRPGDRIAPFGMRGTKKIQDILVDMKVPRHRRQKLAAFCDRSQILWLVGTRRGRAAPITERTRLVLELKAVGSQEELHSGKH